jgi:hypothetical protein
MYKKILIFAIVILFFGSSIIPSVTTKTLQKPALNETGENINLYKESNPLKIENIKGGLGVSFTLTNEGNTTVYDISINIKAFGNYLRVRSPEIIKIPVLMAGQTTKVKIGVSGFGIGRPIDYTRIKLKINAPEMTTLERTILFDVIGPFVNIASVFINDEKSYPGYTLFCPEFNRKTYLINNSGGIVNSWESDYFQGTDCYLLENGNLLRTCLPRFNLDLPLLGITGRIEMYTWEGNLIWEFEYSNEVHCLHHGFEVLPNGNILMIAVEAKTSEDAILNGRNPLTLPAGEIWPSFIMEVEPTLPNGGNIVWEWHVWDHLIQDFDPTKKNYGVVGDHPELVDINFGTLTGFLDWNHFNSIHYNEELDQILISSHIQNEIWIIDHSTTSEEAAGHTGGRYGKGGDLLYRWGNPQVYRAGTAQDQQLFGQHDARWIEPGFPGEGHITIFNNGLMRPGSLYSSVEEIVPPIDEDGFYYHQPGYEYGPKDPIWIYTAEKPSDFFSPIISGAERLPNGNTLICNGLPGIFFEVTHEKEIIWQYNNLFPDTINVRVTDINRYPLDYPGIGNNTNKPVNKEYNAPRLMDILNFFKNLLDTTFLRFVENIVNVLKNLNY